MDRACWRHQKKKRRYIQVVGNACANGCLFLPVIRATHTQEVLGEQGRRIRELTSLIQKRFKFPENSVSLYAAKVQNRGLSAVAQCESLRYKLLNGLAVRRACYGVLRFIMESGAKGCEVVVSGKLRAARAKSMKFTVRFIRFIDFDSICGCVGRGGWKKKMETIAPALLKMASCRSTNVCSVI